MSAAPSTEALGAVSTAGTQQLRRQLADQAFSRAAGAPLVAGNRVDLLLDARENYPAWQRAIEGAARSVHLEMYIFHDDRAGHEFAELLVAKAREGVQVRVLYDWVGALGKTPARFWRRMRAGGVEVRCFNPPHFDSPLRWFRRDHRKALIVDGEVAFVSGLCIGQDWAGWPERGVAPWRDTGVAIRGPAVADVAHAFGEVWAAEGEPVPAEGLPRRGDLAPAGEQALRVIATSPDSSGLLRLDLLWTAIARERLWLADAYFVGTSAYISALQSAARAGVDVRLLVPSGSDIEMVASLSRTQYRPLLEAGVRVFEWDGPMMHAKTAVVDGHWARVGSTNLNVASWVGNWELDVCVDDDDFGATMEDVYRTDLEGATEIVLGPGRRVEPSEPRLPAPRARRISPGSASRAASAALEFGGAVGAAVTQRSVAPAEARSFRIFGVLLLVVALVAFVLPRVFAVPIGLGAGWMGLALLARVGALRREGRRGRS